MHAKYAGSDAARVVGSTAESSARSNARSDAGSDAARFVENAAESSARSSAVSSDAAIILHINALILVSGFWVL